MISDPDWAKFKEDKNIVHCTTVHTTEKYYVYALYTLEFGYFYVGGAYGNANRINEHGGPKGAVSSGRIIRVMNFAGVTVYRRIIAIYSPTEIFSMEVHWWRNLKRSHPIVNDKPGDTEICRKSITRESYKKASVSIKKSKPWLKRDQEKNAEMLRTLASLGARSRSSEQQRLSSLSHWAKPESKKIASDRMLGNTHLLGYKFSTESKSKMSKAMMGNTNQLGYKQSEETKQKRKDTWAKKRVSTRGYPPYNTG